MQSHISAADLAPAGGCDASRPTILPDFNTRFQQWNRQIRW
jgi:hypothetical protein